MATEAINGAPAAGAAQKTDTSNTAAPDAGNATALNGGAPNEVSAPQAEAVASSSVDRDADSSLKNAGEKHERDDAAEKGTQAPKDEPATKKQKTDAEPSKTANGTEAKAATNGDKKRGPGRPKKSEGGANGKPEKKAPKPRATEGIGSRTRSRVQV
ncbi:hypothetical protein AJ78_04001 [Emergomyces pasteurianus Ep9510]|uniref:Uncharacterized protein n=1 Tax=Emergomyces pasteurianus Ep9510 TaxID=1447872 RepID=A0A1J9QI03_9EURO|nr:hypothetical protein AJ78_04001 [Emergomyces pasteurianus Ep9510]